MYIASEIKKIAERVVHTENRRRALATFLKEIGNEKELIYKHAPFEADKMNIAAVDGGIVKKSLHGLDCVLVRSAGVCFTYSDSKIHKVEYFPSKFPTPEASVTEGISDIDWSYHTSLVRLRTEISNAINCIEKFSPNLLMLHGSIIPHYADKPAKSSPVYSLYKEVIDLYAKLFALCEKNKTMLCGVIEDSRSSRFCEIVKDHVLPQTQKANDNEMIELLNKTKDTNLLFWVLDKGERSKEFRYSDKPQEHPVLRDFEAYWGMLHAFYLKTAKWDRPIRVEYVTQNSGSPLEYANKLASMVLAVSGQHDIYGLPTPLIEADSVAKLSENEIENFYSQILTYTGNIPSMFTLRRENRPF